MRPSTLEAYDGPEAYGEGTVSEDLYPKATREMVELRHKLAPATDDAFRTFNERVFEDGALPAKVKQLIAVAVAHVTQCPYCIQGHTKAALRAGASREELMEAVWVAAEMRAGAALAHALLMLDTVEKRERKPPHS